MDYDAQAPRYLMNRKLPEFGGEGQERLGKARVLVVGAGGLGSPVLLYLTAAGVGHITLADFDVLDETNLQRQILYSTDDIGRPKAELAVDRLRALNPQVDISHIVERLGTESLTTLAREHDLVMDCVDNFPTKYAIADACVAAETPWVWGTVVGWMSQVSVFSVTALPHHPDAASTTLRELWPHPPADPDDVPSSRSEGVLGSVVGVTASLMATEAVKVLSGAGSPLAGRISIQDCLHGEIDVIPVSGSRQ